MAFCSMCGTQIADGATVCAACSGRAATVPVVVNTGSGLADNVAGMLAYVTIIPAIIFLLRGTLQQEPVRPVSRMAVHILQRSVVDSLDRAAHRGSCSVAGFPHHIGLAADRPGRLYSLDHPADKGEPGPHV